MTNINVNTPPAGTPGLGTQGVPGKGKDKNPKGKGKKADISAYYMMAMAMASQYKTLTLAMPSKQESETAYVEQGICNALANNQSYASVVAFWEGMKNSLPPHSELGRFAASQYNMLTGDPELVKDLANVQNDANAVVSAEKAVQDAHWYSHWYYEHLLGEAEDTYNGQVKVADTREGILMGMSQNSGTQATQSDATMINTSKTAAANCSNALEQMDELGKSWQLTEIQN